MKTTNGYGNDYHGYNGCFVLYYSFSIMIFVLKFCILAFSDEIVYANSADPDETAPSHQGLHCLPLHKVFLKTSA